MRRDNTALTVTVCPGDCRLAEISCQATVGQEGGCMENQSQKSGENRRARAVFRAAGADGTRWLFVMLSDDVWAIRRNGKQVASGAADPASIDAGLHKFLTLATGGGLEADEHVENRSV